MAETPGCYINANGVVIKENVFYPRRMLNAVERFVSVARDMEQIRAGKDVFKIVFIISCLENLQNLGNPSLASKSKVQTLLDFFGNYTSDSDKQYIRTHFRHDDDDPFDPEEDSFKQFIGVLNEYRNCAAHEGDYWDYGRGLYQTAAVSAAMRAAGCDGNEHGRARTAADLVQSGDPADISGSGDRRILHPQRLVHSTGDDESPYQRIGTGAGRPCHRPPRLPGLGICAGVAATGVLLPRLAGNNRQCRRGEDQSRRRGVRPFCRGHTGSGCRGNGAHHHRCSHAPGAVGCSVRGHRMAVSVPGAGDAGCRGPLRPQCYGKTRIMA